MSRQRPGHPGHRQAGAERVGRTVAGEHADEQPGTSPGCRCSVPIRRRSPRPSSADPSRLSVDGHTAEPGVAGARPPPLATPSSFTSSSAVLLSLVEQHLLDDVGHRRRLHRAQRRRRRRRRAAGRRRRRRRCRGRSAAGSARWRRRRPGRSARCGSPVTRASLTSRASYGPGLDAADVVDPARREVLVVVARCRRRRRRPGSASRRRPTTASASASSGVGVVTGFGIVGHRIRRARQQRVAAADEVQVAGDHPAGRRRGRRAPRS